MAATTGLATSLGPVGQGNGGQSWNRTKRERTRQIYSLLPHLVDYHPCADCPVSGGMLINRMSQRHSAERAVSLCNGIHYPCLSWTCPESNRG